MNKEFWEATLIRAIRTVCQTAIAMIGTGQVGILEIDWLKVLSVSAVAGLLSVLTSIATGLPEVDEKINQLQTNYNTDTLREMVGEDDEEENDTTEE